MASPGSASGMAPATFHVDFLRSLPDEGPVTMINFMRFRERSLDGDGSGFDAYQRYSKADMPLLKAVGGTVLWAGRVEGVAVGAAEGRWDWSAVVRYPSRAAFLAMVTSEDYAAANVHRENGVEAHTIFAASETYSKFKG